MSTHAAKTISPSCGCTHNRIYYSRRHDCVEFIVDPNSNCYKSVDLCAVCCVLCAVVCALSEFLFEHLNSRREDSRCIRQGIRKMQNQREQKITTIRVKPWSARSAPVDRLKICPAVLQGKLPAILILQKSRQLEEVQIRLLHD